MSKTPTQTQSCGESIMSNALIPTIPTFAQHIDDATLAMVYEAHCNNLRLAGKFADKPYNQRNKNVTLAHIRHCIKETRKYNVTYGDIITLKDLAMKSPECKWETRLAILSLPPELQEKHYSDRGNAMAVFRVANPNADVEGDDSEPVAVDSTVTGDVAPTDSTVADDAAVKEFAASNE